MAAELRAWSHVESVAPTAARSTAEKLLPLEGLRGIAAIVVVIHHLRLEMFQDTYLRIFQRLGPIGRNFLDGAINGTFAVWLFWVMSAMVLSLRFYRAATPAAGRDMLADAAIRRYPRLAIPVLASVLFAWCLMATGLDRRGEMIEVFGSGGGDLNIGVHLSPRLFDAIRSALWDTFFAYDSTTTYNGVLWTMEKELLGSWFLFAWLALLGGERRRWLFGAMTIIVVSLMSLDWLGAFVAGAMLCDGFVNGIAGTIWGDDFFRRTSGWVRGLPAFIAGVPVLLWLAGITNRGQYYLVLSSVVTAFALASGPARRLLSTAPALFFGKISFGVYLVHAPLISALSVPVVELVDTFAPRSVSAVVAAVVVMKLSLLCGWGIWFLVDRHAVSIARTLASWIGGPSPSDRHRGTVT